MLPPQPNVGKHGLLTSQFSALKDSISQVILSELTPLRILIECSAKDIDERLLKLEDRLQNALVLESLSSHTSQPTEVVHEKQNITSVNIDSDSKEFTGNCINR
jgi:hypothetical protein